jgi:hypothetical protein
MGGGLGQAGLSNQPIASRYFLGNPGIDLIAHPETGIRANLHVPRKLASLFESAHMHPAERDTGILQLLES